MKKIPLADQLHAIEQARHAAVKAKNLTSYEQECLEYSLKTLRWLEAHPEIMQTAAAIWQDDTVKAIAEHWPGVKVAHARKGPN